MISSVGFNLNNGYMEGVVRGYWSSLLSNLTYMSLTQCDTLENMKLQLMSTEYSKLLNTDDTPSIAVSEFTNAASSRLVGNYNYLVKTSYSPLSKFLDYIRYSYVIDNIILLLVGSMHKVDINEVLGKCHPLGMFDSIAALCVAADPEELYNLILVDTPIVPYFKSCVNAKDFDEVNIEIIRNTLYKAYYEDFYKYCASLGGPTAVIMKNILEFESDRRIITLTINSLNTDLSDGDKLKMYPTSGVLYPSYTTSLSRANDLEEVRAIINGSGLYPFFSTFDGTDKSLENVFFEYEVKLNRESFMNQFHFGIFYSYMRLMEQEVRNITWIAECIAQRQKVRINNYIPLFDS